MDKHYTAANIPSDSVDKITSLEKELSEENNEDVVLVAYTSREPKD